MKLYKSVAMLIAVLLAILTLFGCQSENEIGREESITTTEACVGEHVDDNGNELCDLCGRSVVVLMDFYAVNDLHGKFCDTNTQPGVDELTTYLMNARQNDDYVVFLSSGDMWQGSSESNLTHGGIITEWMNEVNFDAMTIGNHEFDWGDTYIEQNLETAEFPFLAINIYDRETNEPAAYCEPSVLLEKGGIQIGIIGAIGDCYSSISGDKVEDVYFKTGDELTELVKAESNRLRNLGADLIVYSLHDGYGSSRSGTGKITASWLSSYYDIELSDGYVDVVFEGHTHQNYTLVDPEGVYHLQGGGDNEGLSHVEFKINTVTGENQVTEAKFISSSTYDELPDDPIVDMLMEKYDEYVSVGEKIVGKNRSYRNSNVIRSAVCRLYYEAGIRAWGEDYDIVLGGGFISVRSPYHIPVGDITYAQLQAVLPFDNKVVLCSIKGRDLQSKFFNSTNDKYGIYVGEYGQTVKDDIDPNATYYVVVDDFTSSYTYNNLTVVATYAEDIYARDFLAEYMREGGWS